MSENISNEYNMVDIFQTLGKNFYGDDLSTQRLGMFGFTSEALARMFGATILDSNMRAKEYHTITAKKMDTLLYDASILKMDVETANPSEMPVYITFNAENIHREEYQIDEQQLTNKTYVFLIEKDTNINIAGYNFMLEWDIAITAQWNGSQYVYSARYVSEGDIDPNNEKYIYPKETTLSTLSDKYIQGNLMNIDKTKVFMIKTNLRQMSKKYEYYVVTANDVISLTGLEFPYDDFISHFNVYYRPNQESSWEYIQPISIYDTSSYKEKTIQYEIDKDNNILILNAIGFTPNINSEFRIDMYTTKGSLGNINYSGDYSDIICELNSYDDRHIYTGMKLLCMPISKAINGKDQPNIETIRGNLIRTKASKNSLSTEYDLYNFMKDRDLIDDFLFIKKRSDILEHIFCTFMIPRMENGDIIPSSTMNLLVEVKEDIANGLALNDTSGTESGLLTIMTSTPFELIQNEDTLNMVKDNFDTNSESNFMRFLAEIKNVSTDEGILTRQDLVNYENEQIPVVTSDGTEYIKRKLFALPYTISYDIDTQMSSIFMTSINRNVNMGWMDLNIWQQYQSQIITNFAMDHITIKRNSALGENSYKITVTIMANGDYSNLGTPVNEGDYSHNLMLKGFTYTKTQSDMTNMDIDGTDKLFAYFDFDFISYNDGLFTFEANIDVIDSLFSIENEKIVASKSLYRLNSLVNSENKLLTDVIKEQEVDAFDIVPNDKVAFDIFDLKISIGIYYLTGNLRWTDGDKQIPENQRKPKIFLDNTTAKVVSIKDKNEKDLGFPQFTKTGYISGTKEPVTRFYELTDVYSNSSDLIDIYTDMSYVIRCNTEMSTIGDKRYILFRGVPVIQYSKSIDSDISERLTEIITSTKTYLDEINKRLDNSFSVDYKFFRTYGPCQYFKLMRTKDKSTISDENILLPELDIRLEINAILKEGISATDGDILSQMKTFLKSYCEKLNNEDDDYTIYMSNITTELENNFSDVLKSVDLVDLSGKEDKYRIIYYNKPIIENLTTSEDGRKKIREYVPEYINLPLENIKINIIR